MNLQGHLACAGASGCLREPKRTASYDYEQNNMMANISAIHKHIGLLPGPLSAFAIQGEIDTH